MRIIPNFTVLVLLIACEWKFIDLCVHLVNKTLLFHSGSVLWAACAIQGAYACDSCGHECASACGTRHFRTCCFNYLRKRSGNPPIEGPSFNQRMTRPDNMLRHSGGMQVYRGYLVDDGPALEKFPEIDVEMDFVKPANDNMIRILNES